MSSDVIRAGQYNIGHICTRRQCDDGLAGKLAMRLISPNLSASDYTFADLEAGSNRFAGVLKKLGFSSGDLFFTFLPKAPEQFFAFLGGLKLQLIVGTLFSSFGEEAILARLRDARAKGLITKKSFLKKITAVRDRLPDLKYILLADSDAHLAKDILSYPLLMADASPEYAAALTGRDIPSVLHYTSGSTGKPKGVLYQHNGILHINRTTREVLTLKSDDIFWCTADQGWVTGTSYGIIGPWSLGVTQIHFAGTYDAVTWLNILERERVSVWYTAPTALRMLMREDPSIFCNLELRSLRHIFSVGEPLNPEVIRWARNTLGKEIYDTWFQTETGAIMIANRPGLDIRPGSMGKPVAGIDAVIMSDKGRPIPDGKKGSLCLKAGWSSIFAAYLNNETAYRKKFRNGFYYSGDIARRDRDGYFWFIGRSDDIINTAGHLLSPFEVESALLEIEEVAESAVVGVPDDLLFEKVVAFLRLRPHCEWSAALEIKIRIHVSNKLSTIATPQQIIVVDSIPKNKSGKIMRRVLKAGYLGRDAGDTSTMET